MGGGAVFFGFCSILDNYNTRVYRCLDGLSGIYHMTSIMSEVHFE